MNLFVHKDDLLRHQILGIILKKKAEHNKATSPIPAEDISIHIDEIAKRLKINGQKVRQMASTLVEANEAVYIKPFRGMLYTGQKAFISHSERKYLKLGRKYVVDFIKDSLYIIVSAIAIISAIGSLVLYMVTIRNTQEEVNRLRKEVQQLQQSINQPKTPK